MSELVRVLSKVDLPALVYPTKLTVGTDALLRPALCNVRTLLTLPIHSLM